MKLVIGFIILMLHSSILFADYVDYGNVGTIAFRTDGGVRFSFKRADETVKCNDSSDWHHLKQCPTENLACENGLKRVAALLLSVKLAHREISFTRDGCEVSNINLRD